MREMHFMLSATLLLLGLGAAGAASAGSIKGAVVIGGAVPAPKKVDVTIDQYVCGTEKDAGDLLVSPRKELKNAVVWLDNPPANATVPAPTKVEMDQNGCVFVPRVVIVPAGGTVDFLNSDRLLHNIHATPKLNVSFNRTQPKDRTIPVTFAKPEIVQINCDLHSWMIGLGGRLGPSLSTRSPARTASSASTTCRPASTRCTSGTSASEPSQASAAVDGQQPARVTVEMKAR